MKRIILVAIIVLLLSICPITIYGDTAEICIDKPNIKCGEEFEITLNYTCSFNIYAISFILKYDDSIFEYISSQGVLHSDSTVKIVEAASGENNYKAKIVLRAISSGRGDLIFSGEAYNDKNSGFASYTRSVSVYQPGDINGDGKVNNKDLVRLFKYLSDWKVDVDEKALDINGDGKVNSKDLLRLFKYLSNWDVEIY